MAAFVPLIAEIAPELINLIVGLVHKKAPIAEASNGPSTGAVKFSEVFQAVIAALNTAAAAGQINKALPPDDTIKTIIQAVVQSMQLSGLIGTQPQSTTPTSNPLTFTGTISVTQTK